MSAVRLSLFFIGFHVRELHKVIQVERIINVLMLNSLKNDCFNF